VSFRVICKDLDLPGEEVKTAIHSLLCSGLIKEDGRDEVEWDHNEATFCTVPSRREEIDRMIEK